MLSRKPTTTPQTARDQRTYFWHHQTKMGLQLHGFSWVRKSKRRTQFNYAGLQHQTKHQHPWCSRFNCQTPSLEHTFQEKGLAFYKSALFKADFSFKYF